MMHFSMYALVVLATDISLEVNLMSTYLSKYMSIFVYVVPVEVHR